MEGNVVHVHHAKGARVGKIDASRDHVTVHDAVAIRQPGRFTVSGTVRGADGKPAAGAKVHAFAPHSPALTLEEMMRGFGMPVHVEPYTVDELLEGRAELEIGGLRMELAHVPGHSPDSVTFFLPERGELFAGDTLFAGSIGRADLPGGNPGLLIDGIRGKLFALPENTRVFPGHGPATSVGAERAGNPYCGD